MSELVCNHAIESAAIEFVVVYELAQGRSAVDTRYKAAPADPRLLFVTPTGGRKRFPSIDQRSSSGSLRRNRAARSGTVPANLLVTDLPLS